MLPRKWWRIDSIFVFIEFEVQIFKFLCFLDRPPPQFLMKRIDMIFYFFGEATKKDRFFFAASLVTKNKFSRGKTRGRHFFKTKIEWKKNYFLQNLVSIFFRDENWMKWESHLLNILEKQGKRSKYFEEFSKNGDFTPICFYTPNMPKFDSNLDIRRDFPPVPFRFGNIKLAKTYFAQP